MNENPSPMVESDAWECIVRAQKDWRQRDAPSIGARAKAIARMLSSPPSYIQQVEDAIGLFLGERQMAEQYGHQRQRRSLAC